MKLAISDYHNFNHQYQTTPPLSIPHLFQFFHKAIRISETRTVVQGHNSLLGQTLFDKVFVKF